ALAPRKVAVDDAMTAFEDHRFAAALCDRLRGEVGEIAAGKRAERAVPAPALDRLRRADGNFWAGDQPVMLVGAMGYSELKQDLDQVRDLGFNTVGTDFASGASLAMLTGPDQADLKRLEELKQAIALCAGKGFTWSYTPSLHYFPLWALKAHADVTGGEQMDLLPDWSGRDRTRKAKDYGSFFPFSIFSPTVHTLVGRLFDVVLPELERAPGSGICWLMNEPRYHKDRDPVARERFQAFLRQRHASLEELNARWGTSHRDFAAIELQAGGSDPGRHDYLDWHQAEVGGWFSWLGGEARKRAPGVPLSSKPMAWTLFAPETGIDFEREALEWEVPGCDSGREPHDRWTAFNGVEAGTLLDFQKSVAPGKPLADHEYHWVHAPGLSAEYSRATFLHSYLHGLRWSQFWVWGNGDLRPGSVAGGSGMQYTAVSQPAVLWGAAQAALDLRRLAPVMAAFPQPAQVAIAFSRPTLFRDGTAHRDRIHAAYRAATALDAPVGFATGRMMREGRLARYRLLILPGDRLAEPAERDAIQAFLDQGGTVVRIGPCLAQDPYRRPLAPLTAGKGRLVQLDPAEPPALAARLDDLLTAAGVERPVRVRARDGRPAWPLECRTAIVDGRRVVALIGSDKAARRVVLEGAQPVAGWQDLLSGERQAAGEFTLAPNEVRFLRLDP
ncbi:MAG: beta-galactosidase, partial [Planctomycetes bacterium]|nr:beta-galactosidase [Planctomycetota bacterium]